MKIVNRINFALLAGAFALNMSAQASYTYLTEGFEEAAWGANKPATVETSTGTWGANKNMQSAEQAYDGNYSLKISSKAGFTSPLLSEGLGWIVYYANMTNRTLTVETSPDNVVWTAVESYKATCDWTKHVVKVVDPTVRYVRFSTNSNNQVYIDNVLFTRLDGTDASGRQEVATIGVRYFLQDFEKTSSYPASKEVAAVETSYNVENQGEWKYLNAYRGTNDAYITDGSGHSLRMLKNTSYVITPVLSQGVVDIRFDEGRRGKKLNVYASTDEGATWSLVQNVVTDTHNVVGINEEKVNRIKIANEEGSDVDLDNLEVNGYPQGTPASIVTGSAADITGWSATVGGQLKDKGDKPMIEWGLCWNTEGNPDIEDNVVVANDENFSLTLSALPCETKIYCRAYALSMAGVAYGDEISFTTLPASIPSLTSSLPVCDEALSDEVNVYIRVSSTITSTGGDVPSEVGVCYSETNVNPTIADTKIKGYLYDNVFSVALPLKPSTKYYMAAYAVNSAGVGYAPAAEITTPEIVIPDYPHNVYYIAPEGDDATADGSIEHPYYHLQPVVDIVVPGDTIYMLAGEYKYDTRVSVKTIGRKNSGRIALFAKGGRAVLNYSAMDVADANQGIHITGSYWHIYGLDICNAGDNGMLIERNKPSGGNYNDIKDKTDEGCENIIENCRFYRNADTGLQMKNLAENNMVINCDSYFNADPDHGNADGYAVKISHGTGNYFYGCRAWANSDDGWDGFIKSDGGFPDDITTTLESCWAMENGYLEDGTIGKGNGNGFKMGSDQGRNNMVLNRCIAFNNVNKGFDQNHNTGNMILNNCSAYSSKDTSSKSRFTYRLDEAVASGHEIVLTNCVAVSDGISDRNKSEYAPHSVVGKLVTSDLNCLPSDFVSIDGSVLKGERSADGSLPVVNFMRIAEGNTKLIDKGTPVIPYPGESIKSVGIEYNGSAPDLGYYETGEASAVENITTDFPNNGMLEITSTVSGLTVVKLLNANPAGSYVGYVFDVTGRQIVSKQFTGCATVIEIPAFSGIAIICVSGENYQASAKVALR